MKTRIRQLESAYVQKRAQLGAEEFSDQLVTQWEAAARDQTHPDVERLLEDLRDDHYYVKLNSQSTNYIQRCRVDDSPPKASELRAFLVGMPWLR